MSKWIFQGKPSRYDIADRNNVDAGKKETWLVTRYRKEMSIGDVVYFWRSGERVSRGLYAWGMIEGEPEFYENWGWGILVIYQKRFPEHISYAEIKEFPEFADHLLFTMPIGTNFSLDEDQGSKIEELVDAKFGGEYTVKEESNA